MSNEDFRVISLLTCWLLTISGPSSSLAQEPSDPTLPVSLDVDLQSANLSSADRERSPLIAIDPGHGGREPGAVHRQANGRVDLLEKDVNLEIALRLDALLRDHGFRTALTRADDSDVNVPPSDRNGDGRIDNDDDLQARVDIANAAGAALLFSIHNNGSTSPSVRGTSTWYSIDHPSGAESLRLAALVQTSLLSHLRDIGYLQAVNAGFHDDAGLGKPFGHLFLVGPQTPRVARVSQMPGVVGESLYITSDREAELLKNTDVLNAIAEAYFEAAVEFLTG